VSNLATFSDFLATYSQSYPQPVWITIFLNFGGIETFFWSSYDMGSFPVSWFETDACDDVFTVFGGKL